MSSREVKSTGVKFRVVIFPSTVMAKVALTNGRAVRAGGRSFRPGFAFLVFTKKTSNIEHRTSNTEVSEFGVQCAALRVRCLPQSLRLRDFMFRGCDFTPHLPNLDAFRDAAGFVEEVNDTPGSAADHDYEESE